MIETVTTPPEEEDDEEFQDRLSNKVTMIKEEVAQIASNMETLISQIKAFQETVKSWRLLKQNHNKNYKTSKTQ